MAANGFLTGSPVTSMGNIMGPQTVLISAGGHQTPFILQSQFPMTAATQSDLNKLSQLQQSINNSAVVNNAAAAQLMGASHVALQGLPHSGTYQYRGETQMTNCGNDVS